ncbi:hypothetical protein HBI56_199750 [Parastagonospora nodorum]|nr:hypothetical protein HBI10_209220 [Parastagonospora nodorum]KAH4010760.1 hypothetical protein HBI13_206980 [Parastagonospora nodorum]KAH4217582.1 hypothetical protein HBI06_214860 [Parastagonospora nodorum]KAH4229458.1 hypothetical protein HBI05_196120 [Parastagonospora nodorum]KAH4289154.1 hypothetical protein HBI02_207850 [Parastagonospora nodorum]
MKRTYVPVPGSKPKPKAKDTPSKVQLSQEFIGSDSDSPAETAPKPKPKTTIAVHRPTAAAKSKEKPSKKDAAAPKPQPKAKPAPKKPTPATVVTQAQADELSTPEQTDDDDVDVPTRDIQTKLAERDASASESDSGSSDSGSSDSGSSDESFANEAPQLAQAQARPSQTQPHSVEFRPAQAFVPPKGFTAVTCNDKTMSKSARIFDNLEGKQIWHITAPVGVSLNDLKEIAMDSALNGGAVLQHKGTSYGFSTSEEREHVSCEVMVPHKNGYKAVSTPISQSLRLQAAVQLPKLTSLQADQNTGSEAAASITRSTIRAPRPQLKGLKMRFLPIGFGSGDIGTLGDSDSEGDTPQETAGLGMPNELNLPSRKEKRKHTELNGDSRIEPPSKKPKKPRTAEDVQRKEERRARKEKKRAQASVESKS